LRLLTVHPGADVSTADVYDGLVPALQARGAECVPYALNSRIARAGSWLMWNWKRAGKPDPRPTQADIVYQAGVGIIERALRLQPDWVLVFSGMYLHPDLLIMLRRAGIRVAVILSESPYDASAEQRILPFVDLAWTNERSCVSEYRCINPNTHYLAHAFDPTRHYPVADKDDDEASARAHDVVFVGTGFAERIEVLDAVDWTGIDLGLYGSWNLLPSRHHLRKYLRGGYVSNAQAAALYRRAKIGLNLYRSSIGFGRGAPRIEGAESLNPRALELAACGVFQISDHRAEVDEVFSYYVSTFRPGSSGISTHLEEVIRTALADPESRRAHAEMSRKLVQPHTFSARAEQVLHDLQRATHRMAA
jgi:spore maturation protein CgeB